MKKPGSVIEFTARRNSELYRAFIGLLSEGASQSIVELYSLAPQQPCSRFWVSEERAGDVIGALLAGKTFPDMLPMRKKMYDEILTRVRELLRANPGMPVCRAVFQVVNSSAPEFYLTPASARTIISRHLKSKRQKARKNEF